MDHGVADRRRAGRVVVPVGVARDVGSDLLPGAGRGLGSRRGSGLGAGPGLRRRGLRSCGLRRCGLGCRGGLARGRVAAGRGRLRDGLGRGWRRDLDGPGRGQDHSMTGLVEAHSAVAVGADGHGRRLHGEARGLHGGRAGRDPLAARPALETHRGGRRGANDGAAQGGVGLLRGG